MEITGSCLGYEYRYRFWMDKSIIERFSSRPDIKFVFDIRTYFVVKRSDGGGGDEVVDSERDEYVVRDESALDEEWMIYNFWYKRLEDDYWMSKVEVRELISKAVGFARQQQKELADVSLPLIPVAVELDVCTVQKAGEPISDAFGRALKAQHLFPLSLCAHADEEDENYFSQKPLDEYWYMTFLRSEIQVDRVENVDDTLEFWMADVENVALAGLEGVCHLCEHKATVGAQIVRLESCGHRFHYHCIVEWLLKYEKSCPTCRCHIDCKRHY